MNEAQDIRFNIAEFLWGEHPINWPTPCQPRWWQFRQKRKMYEMQGVFGPLKTSNIEAFWRERRKGQSIYEDCGGYLLRCYRAMVGLPVEEAYTYDDAAADIIADAGGHTSWSTTDPKREQQAANTLGAVALTPSGSAAMLAALAPFAAVAERDIGDSEDDADLFQVMSEGHARAPRLTVGDFRRALAAFLRANAA